MSERTNDPALTQAWLKEPREPKPPKRFAVDRGQVRYRRWLQSDKTHRRRAYLVGATCELAACGAAEPSATLVFDHCHRHGWIRAVLCNAHNVRIAHLEAAWLEHGVDLSPTPYWPILMSCSGCVNDEPIITPASEAHWERIMRLVRERIAAGEFEPDGQLPSTAALADQYEVSKPTVRQAITVMTALGELRGEQGVGVFRVKREGADG